MAWVHVEILVGGKLWRGEFSDSEYLLDDKKGILVAFAVRRLHASRELPNRISHYVWNPLTTKDRIIDGMGALVVGSVGRAIAGPLGGVVASAANTLIGSRYFPIHTLMANVTHSRVPDAYYECESGERSQVFIRPVKLGEVIVVESAEEA